MTLWPAWFNVYCIIGSILTTIVFFGFCIQTFIYKYNQQDELTTTYSILAAIGLIKILSSCASSYVFTCSIITTNKYTFYLLTDWLNFIRIIAVFLQMLFLVWRLELTFIRTNYQLSNANLIFCHIVIVTCIILHTIIRVVILPDDKSIYIYSLAQLLRLGVFFGVSCQFVNKLFDLIASQHTSNAEYELPKHAKLMINSGDATLDTDENKQLLNELSGELRLMIESQMDNGAFTEKNYKLISMITKLSFLACIDFITLFVYVTFAEMYTMILANDLKFHVIFGYIMYSMEPFCFLIFSLTVWFSLIFAEKQYLCLFGCCHRRFMKYVENRAKKRAIKQQIESLSNEKSINSGEMELERSIMQG